MTNDDYPILAGQVMTTLDLQELFQNLTSVGVASRIGESCHFTGGQYLQIVQDNANMDFEKLEKDEYLVGGDAPTVSELMKLTELTSQALTRLNLKHRFEIYYPSAEANMVGYFHHNWPQEEKVN